MLRQVDADVARLLVSCPDRPGIVAAISALLAERDANIVESQQYSLDPYSGGEFFLRLEFHLARLPQRRAELVGALSELAARLGASFRLVEPAHRKRVALFVSTADHAAQEVLWRARSGDIAADVVMMVSNHPTLRPLAETWGVEFHHIPVDAGHREDAERRAVELMAGRVDLVVLARYMQIVTPLLLGAYPHQVINIHHSFLPAFVGADPYRRAHERGVKLIGATAHYVTEDLDAGPIIDQDVDRVDHRHSVEDLRRIGRHVERMVLARAVGWHVADRVVVHGNRTIVFQ